MKNYWVHTKHKIARWLLADEVAKVDMERQSFIAVQKQYERKIKDFNEYRKSLTVIDLVREQMKGFNPHLHLDDSDLTNLMDSEELDGFLAKAKDLSDNIVYKKVCEHIKRNQAQYAVLEAGNLEQMNFARATINGVSLVEDEINSLLILYNARHEVEEKYDKYSAV